MAQNQTGFDNNHSSFQYIPGTTEKNKIIYLPFSLTIFLSAQKRENAEIQEEIKTSVTELLSIKDKQIFAVKGETLNILGLQAVQSLFRFVGHVVDRPNSVVILQKQPHKCAWLCSGKILQKQPFGQIWQPGPQFTGPCSQLLPTH